MKVFNWIGALMIIIYAMIFSLVGMGLSPLIAKLNLNNTTYGEWASYFVTMLLWYLFIKDVKLMKNKRGKNERRN
jgi:hypothetical protein